MLLRELTNRIGTIYDSGNLETIYAEDWAIINQYLTDLASLLDEFPQYFSHANDSNATLGASSGSHFSPNGTTNSATYSNVAFVAPDQMKISRLALRLATTQPATGQLIFGISINGAIPTQWLSIPANSVAGLYTQDITPVTISPGDYVSFYIRNYASSTSAQFRKPTALAHFKVPA